MFKDYYLKLQRLLSDKGYRFRKKHGNWCIHRVIKDWWLIMDTWNGHIMVVKTTENLYDNDSTIIHWSPYDKQTAVDYYTLAGNFGEYNEFQGARMLPFWYYHLLLNIKN